MSSIATKLTVWWLNRQAHTALIFKRNAQAIETYRLDNLTFTLSAWTRIWSKYPIAQSFVVTFQLAAIGTLGMSDQAFSLLVLVSSVSAVVISVSLGILSDLLGDRRHMLMAMSTLGVIGYGQIGRRLGALGQAQQSGKAALDSFPIDPNVLQQLQQNMPIIRDQMKQMATPPLLLVMPQLRPLLARYGRLFAPGLHILSYNEVPENREVSLVGTLG